MGRWLTPNAPIPEETRCRRILVPDDLSWLSAVSGALLPLTYPWNWEDSGTLTAQETADRFLLAYNDMMAEECGGGTCPPPSIETPDGTRPIFRRNPTTDRWEFMQPDGTWSEPTGEDAIPDPTARGEGTSADRLCAAATNAANRIKAIYDGTLEQINEDVDMSELAVFVAGQAAFYIAGTIYPPALAAITISFGAFLGFAEVGQQMVLSNLWNDHFTQRYICCLKANATDTAGVITFDREGVNKCLLESIWTDQQYVLLVTMVIYIHSIIGEQGLNLLGTHTAVSGNCSHCGEWARYFNFELGQSGWGFTTAGDAGEWLLNTGFHNLHGANQTLIGTCNNPVDSGFTITRIKVRYGLSHNDWTDCAFGSHSPSRTLALPQFSGGEQTYDTGYTLSWNGAGDVAMRFFRSGVASRDVVVKEAWYYGTGTMPFSATQGVAWYGG